MNHTKTIATNNSSAAGRDHFNGCNIWSPSFYDKYNIHDLDSAISSILSELDVERVKLKKSIAKTALLDTMLHFCFFGLAGCFLYSLFGSLTVYKVPPSVFLLVALSLVAIIIWLFKPMSRATQEERMQEKKVDIIYNALGRLQERQIWERIGNNDKYK